MNTAVAVTEMICRAAPWIVAAGAGPCFLRPALPRFQAAVSRQPRSPEKASTKLPALQGGGRP